MKEYTFENIKTLKLLKIKVVTLSDRASRGEYEDISGPTIIKFLEEYFTEKKWKFEIDYNVIPDDANLLRKIIIDTKNNDFDFIFTTGSTGISPRDIVPETVKPLVEKEIPGIMELIRVKYGMKIPNAVLSRGIAGIIGQAQIYTLPGSVKAVKDYMTEILKTAEHLIYMFYGIDVHKKHR